jgi:hypothetical protein
MSHQPGGRIIIESATSNLSIWNKLVSAWAGVAEEELPARTPSKPKSPIKKPAVLGGVISIALLLHLVRFASSPDLLPCLACARLQQ